ncbi:AMIN-like domain-containing (lipo)protein [Kribbella lupini]|uniref:AMIN-like domain-containing protein n=1 Tax=Kribbella lupini TaxID=291602 RepID=A0ABP4MUE1_9ACTN
MSGIRIRTNRTNRPSIRTLVAIMAVAAVPVGAVAVPAVAGTSTSAACSTAWGSLPEASSFRGTGTLTNVRTGRHDCFDRVVFDVKGAPSWFRVEYVKSIGTVGQGLPVPLRGGAKLQIVLSVPSYDDEGHSTYNPANPKELSNVTGYRTFRQLATAGSFEGETTIGLGVRARLPFRVFTVAGPGTTNRIVVDVAHTW